MTETIETICNPANWRPNLAAMERKTGLARSTLSQKIANLIKKGNLVVHIENLSDIDALKRRQNNE